MVLDQSPPITQLQDEFAWKQQAMIRFFEGREFAGVESAVILFSFTMTSRYYSKPMKGSFKPKVLIKEAFVS